MIVLNSFLKKNGRPISDWSDTQWAFLQLHFCYKKVTITSSVCLDFYVIVFVSWFPLLGLVVLL